MSEWIKTSDRPPDVYVSVHACFFEGDDDEPTVRTCYRIERDGVDEWHAEAYNTKTRTPDYWTPLPEPPKRKRGKK